MRPRWRPRAVRDRGGGLGTHGAEALGAGRLRPRDVTQVGKVVDMAEEFGAGRLAVQTCLGVYGSEGHDAGALAALVCLGNMEPRSTTQAG